MKRTTGPSGAAGWAGLLLACTVLAQPAGATPDARPSRPNILWIVGENLVLDLGSYGQSNVHTPHLDALAASGIRYTRVFATSPVCAPSRSAFMTGMYQTSTDTHHMRSHRDDDFRLPAGVRPLTHWLQDAGYFTANITHAGGREVGTGKLDLNFVNEGPLYKSDDWAALEDNQPFFAQINTRHGRADRLGPGPALTSRLRNNVQWDEVHRRVEQAQKIQGS